jgi:peptidyl-prolyl cis-trans isomerase A (cyclophilin A)
MKITFRAVGLAAGLAIFAVACVGAQTPAKKAPAKAKAPASSFDKALLSPATLTAKAPAEYDVTFTTTKGDIKIHVTRAWAPNGADRFYNLVRHHFFDGAAFFRNIKGFMVQFGLSPYPEVTSAWRNAKIKDDPVTQHNLPGMITFATSGPDSRTTQVFINHKDNSFLDGQGFSPFGVVTAGLDVVAQLYDGYGEGAPNGSGPEQGLVGSKGKAYLSANFPKLDLIKTTTISGLPAPAAKSATGTKSATKKSAGTGSTKQP